MSKLRAGLDYPTEQERWDDIVNSAHLNLALYAERLMQEAHERRYNLQTRNTFVLAVGAVALIDSVIRPPYIMRANTALLAVGPLAVIDAADPDMSYWNHREWEWNLRQVAGRVQIVDPNVDGVILHETADYVRAVDALQMSKAHFGDTVTGV